MRPGRAARARGEVGAVVTLVVGLAAVLVVVAVGGGVLGRVLVEQRRVAVAADLAALAGASAVQRGEDACAAASRIARQNRATLVTCRTEGEVVRIGATGEVWRVGGQAVRVRARAVAGPR